MNYEVKYDWWLWLFDPFYVEHRKFAEWPEFLAFYHFKCDEHGDQVSYKQGSRGILRCPECLKENKKIG